MLSEEEDFSLRTFLLEEAVARVLKDMFRKRERQVLSELKFPCEEPFFENAAEFLNLLTGSLPNRQRVQRFWELKVTPQLLKSFGEQLFTSANQSQKEMMKEIGKKREEKAVREKEEVKGIVQESEKEERRESEESEEGGKKGKGEKKEKASKKGLLERAKEKIKNKVKKVVHAGDEKKLHNSVSNLNQLTKKQIEEQNSKKTVVPLFSQIRVEVVLMLFLKMTGTSVSEEAILSNSKKGSFFIFDDILSLECTVKRPYFIELSNALRRINNAKQAMQNRQLEIVKRLCKQMFFCLIYCQQKHLPK